MGRALESSGALFQVRSCKSKCLLDLEWLVSREVRGRMSRFRVSSNSLEFLLGFFNFFRFWGNFCDAGDSNSEERGVSVEIRQAWQT